MKQFNWTRAATILLVILLTYAVLYIAVSLLSHFRQAILLFILGALLAYILTPLVNRLQSAFRVRWIAILLAYSMIATCIFVLGLMLFTPFVDQSKSLVDNLHNPSPSSLKTMSQVRRDAALLERTLKLQRTFVAGTNALTPGAIADVRRQIAGVRRDTENLRRGLISGPSHTPRASGKGPANRVSAYPQPQTKVPPSYARAILSPLDQLENRYDQATAGSRTIDRGSLNAAVTQSRKVHSASQRIYHTMATTPILLLRSQSWLDDHNLHVDVASAFGQAAGQISSQGTLVLNNAITILSDAANFLLDTTLILIIAFYLLSDGPRLIRRGIALVPAAYREQASFFVASVDSVLGGYLRGQILLAALAGLLGGGGAAVLGVPYPLLIGIVTAVLEIIPVVGALIAFFPAVLISLFFMPVLTTVILFGWYIVFQQLVTNILGPRIMGIAVGIHPLETLLAVLVGYPIGGYLGAFLAVPTAGVVHILIRETYHYFYPQQLGQPTPHVAARPAPPLSRPVGRRAWTNIFH